MPNTPNMCMTPVISRAASTFHAIGQDKDIDDLTLIRNDKELLVEQPWTTLPFMFGSNIQLPVYNLIDGEFTGEVCELDHKHFNN